MCAQLLIGLAAAMNLSTDLALPNPDKYGRYKTFNSMGYADPQELPTSEEFLEWGRLHARSTERVMALNSDPRPKALVEIGGGFGFLAARAVNQRIHYVYNDLCAEHTEIAESQFEETNYTLFTCKFPQKADFMRSSLKLNYRVVALGAFSVLHFLNPSQIEEFLDATYEILEPGGRAFFTFGSPYNALFGLFPKVYQMKKARFFSDPLNEKFPGEIHNAQQFFHPTRTRLVRPLFNPPTPEPPRGADFKPQYPNYFNAMDPETFAYLVGKDPRRPFRIVRAEYIRRPNPPNQSVQALYAKVGELVGVILEKPESAP